MDLQIVSGEEFFIARFALVGLFTSVDFVMPLEVRDLLTVSNEKTVVYLCEGFVTPLMSALVGLLAGVDPQVLLQRRILGERLSTSNRWTKE